MTDPTENVVHNTEKYRFEVESGSQLSKLEYRIGRDRLALVHTEVPDDLQGQGIGTALVVTALEFAREKNLRVLPYCPFVASYIERHPEWENIVAEI